MLDGLTFEEVRHRYYLYGKRIPGVTTLIEQSGYAEKGSNFYTSRSRQRGTAVHRTAELIDTLCPNATSLDEVLEKIELTHPDPEKEKYLHGVASGWLLCKREIGFKPVHNELLVGSFLYRFGGILDKWGTINNRKALLDLKSWEVSGAKWCKRPAEIQTAGYMLGAKESAGLETDVRFVVALPGNGKCRIWECTGKNDHQVFIACAINWADRYSHGYVSLDGEDYEDDD